MNPLNLLAGCAILSVLLNIAHLIVTTPDGHLAVACIQVWLLLIGIVCLIILMFNPTKGAPRARR